MGLGLDRGIFSSQGARESPRARGCSTTVHRKPLKSGRRDGGIAVALQKDAMSVPQPQSTPALRWVFHRDEDAITCEIDTAGERAFDVCIVPHWDVSASSIERFDTVHRAFERHAELACRLREAGWHRGIHS